MGGFFGLYTNKIFLTLNWADAYLYWWKKSMHFWSFDSECLPALILDASPLYFWMLFIVCTISRGPHQTLFTSSTLTRASERSHPINWYFGQVYERRLILTTNSKRPSMIHFLNIMYQRLAILDLFLGINLFVFDILIFLWEWSTLFASNTV